MELERVLSRMTSNAHVIRTLVEDWSDEETRWKPEPSAWSVLEVINHLLGQRVLEWGVSI